MGIFAANGQSEKDLPVGIDAVRLAIQKAGPEQRYQLGTVSPDGSRFEMTSPKTAISWGTTLVLTLSGNDTATHVVVDYDNVQGAPSALLDGRKNAKAAKQFLERLEAAL